MKGSREISGVMCRKFPETGVKTSIIHDICVYTCIINSGVTQIWGTIVSEK